MDVKQPRCPNTCSRKPAEGLISPQEWAEVAAALNMTPREWQVAVLIFDGKTRDTVARKLNLKPRTVRQYLERLHDKLEVSDRVGLVLRILQVRDDLFRRECRYCSSFAE